MAITQIQKDGKLSVLQSFGPSGPGSNFLGQDIVGMQAFRRTVVAKAPMDLLVVTTTPKVFDYQNQSAMWVFNACPGLQTPKLLFGVSTGLGGPGYAPTVGCYDGVIAVGRVAGSIQLVDILTGIEKWNGDINSVISLMGNNTQAIIQPFWLADPEYTWENSQTGATHWSVAMVPSAFPVEGKPAWEIAVGYSHPKAQFRGEPLSGLPIFRQPYNVGTYKPTPVFIGDGQSVDISKIENAPPAHAYARSGVLAGNRGPVRIAAWPRGTVIDGGQPKIKDLVLGVSTRQIELFDSKGNSLGKLGNSLILCDVTKEFGEFQGAWPKTPPFGPGVNYEIMRKVPAMDPLTGLVAVPVQNLSDMNISWFVIDFKDHYAPKTVYVEKNLIDCGGFSNGMLYGVGKDGVFAKKILDGIDADAGDCWFNNADIKMAMDGKRTGELKISFDEPKNKEYLFWLNDDNDRAEYSVVSGRDIDDDYDPSHKNPNDQMDTGRNCDDQVVNCVRDLEDFTRLHVQVDAQTAASPDITYWVKLEKAEGTQQASINMFEAVNMSMDYLTNAEKAAQQKSKPFVARVGAGEVAIPSNFIKKNGQVSPFLLEGCSEGVGNLVFIVRKGSWELKRTSVKLTLWPAASFWEKYQVTVMSDGNVQKEATKVHDALYQPEKPDEYLLYVHGWNMEGWEKDRWAENDIQTALVVGL